MSLEDGRIYNAAGLWNAESKLLGVYHKTHLQTHDLQFAPRPGPAGVGTRRGGRWAS